MSWLERRRPRKSHPWPPHDSRFSTRPLTREEWWAIGSARPTFAIDSSATSPAVAQDYDAHGNPVGSPRVGDLNKGWF